MNSTTNERKDAAFSKRECGPTASWLIRASDYILGGAAYLIGSAALLGTGVFLLFGPVEVIDVRVGVVGALVVNTILSLMFFLQHSGMVRSSFREFLGRFVHPKYHGAIYTISAGVTLLVLLLLWRPTDIMIASADGSLRYLLRAVFGLSLLMFFWGARSLGSFDSFGLNPLFRNTDTSSGNTQKLHIRGAYRFVRHPLYTATIVMIWSHPDLTVDRLLFNLLWTAWIVTATTWEEKDLAVQFGEAYETYRQNVPMLVPSFRRKVG